MSIKTQTLVVKVHSSRPQMTKTDKKAGEEVAAKHNARSSSTRVVNDLYPAHLLAPIKAAEGRARSLIHSGPTYRWAQNEYLIHIEQFMDMATRAGQVELEHSQAVTAFMNNYSNVLLEAQQELGSMFDASVYPDLEELRNSFALKVRFEHHAEDSSDIRLQLSEDELAEVRSHTEASTRAKFEELAKQPVDKLVKRLHNLIEAMEKPEREVRDKDTGELKEMACPIFKDSTFDNLIAECDQIIQFGDDILHASDVALARKLKSGLATPKQARDSKTVRTETAAFAHSILGELTGVTPPEPAEPEPSDFIPMGIVNKPAILMPTWPEPEKEPDVVAQPAEPDENAVTSAELLADIEAMFL
jgi:hypothetical protein